MERLDILRQLRFRSSTESSVHCGSDQGGLQDPTLNGEQRALGFGPRQFANNEGWKMVESCETIALEESMENIRKLEETIGKMKT